ncbi:hemolysin family protein [Pararhodospirillum photometricum]|uniref:Hemolysin n=1 Tax=Pararhodospirillum photometricum DSM 122 TaxID=1150469 RepID=H6SJV8_PARPM|nr:hemolysin family protein [Pararhodospirillum photometricum]CCG08273.1 Hemolysin [Pararhodospirillum photometricum DSM 122]
MSLALELAVIAFLVILNGWFAMSELAILSARRAVLSTQASQGSRGARVALQLADNPGRFLSSVQIGITLVGILAGAYSGATLADKLAVWIIATWPTLAAAADALAIALVVGAITFASLILGELVPKQIALAAPERVAALVARPMVGVARLALPLVWILEASTRLILRLLGLTNGPREVTQEEVKALIAEGTQNGLFGTQEKEMLSGVLRLGERKIRALMTPRTELVLIDLSWDDERIRRTVRESHHSRFLVCQGDPDEVIGVVQSKDMLDAFLDERPFAIASVVRPLEVVHENAPALQVLTLLRQSTIHMALVVDEYGSIEGIVTATDVLAAIVGSLAEHGEEYEGALFAREDGSWLLDGDVAMDLAAERLGCRLPPGAEADFSTVAGFILWRSSTVLPKVGAQVIWDGWCFEVVDMDGRRIDKVLVSPLKND